MTPDSSGATTRFRDLGAGTLAVFALAYAMAVALLVVLIHNAGVWNVLGNTRLLSPLIDAGIIALTDADSGLLVPEGVPSLDYYVAATDSVDWLLIPIAIAMFIAVWAIKAYQFHGLARFSGLGGSAGQHARAWVYGHGLGRILPLRAGDAGTVSALMGQGADPEGAAKAVQLGRAFIIFEIIVFALVGLFYSGITTWLGEIFWPSLVLLGAYILTRPGSSRAEHKANRAKARSEAGATVRTLVSEPRLLVRLAILSILAFFLVELTAYVIAQAFTSANVIINVEFHVIVMGIVGGYIATLIPVTPGGLGQWEWGMASAMYVGGLGFPECATLAILFTVVRYVAGGLLFSALLIGPGIETGMGRVLAQFSRQEPMPAAVPGIRPAGSFVSRAVLIVGVLFAGFLLDQFANMLLNFWLLESLGYEDVFWTNFWAGATIFVLCLLAFTAAVYLPARTLGKLSKQANKAVLAFALLVGAYFAFTYMHRFPNYLLWFNGQEFGEVDPVFKNDIGFYVFDLPAIWTTLHILTVLAITGLLSSIAFAWVGRDRGANPAGVGRFLGAVGHVSRPTTLGFAVFLGLMLALDTWFRRYSLLNKDNYDHSIPSGAQALDVSGFFSNKNAIWVEAIILAITTCTVVWRLRWARRAVTGAGSSLWQPRFTRGALLLLLLPGLGVDAAFRGGVAIRSELEITPNEPVVQYEYIKNHIDATNKAYGLDKIETKQFKPNGPGAPMPDADKLLASSTFRNAPLWPGYNSWLEKLVDPEYIERVELQPEDLTVYGPTLATFQQQEKLRPYYDFLDVDTVRYNVNGEDKLFASGVRELPLNEPKPWLAWWGQSFVVFTHGHGLVMAPVSGATPNGEPEYASNGIPTRTTSPALATSNESAYYAEGAGSMAYSNLEQIQEHDQPTDTDREQISFDENVKAGVKLDSFFKKVVFGWKSRQFVDIVASDLINDKSRVHYYRTPLERLEHLAPFLYNDTDPYAVTRGDGVTWMVNGMTTSRHYPYSMPGEIGDKSDRRTPFPRPSRWVNYVRDSVKSTVDAYTGDVKLYKYADEPVVNTWADIYPDLFTDKAEMPEPLRKQVQYPTQLFHLQFDDLYVYYHQKDPLLFFSQEDVFDDGDEVVGPVLTSGEAISFSIEPYYWMTETGKDLPASSSPDQFAMSMIFTPENALNLRAFATAYMDGDDYGKLSMLEVPKGQYFPGPEQADSAIDQDPFISQQLGLWQRQGLEVIRGHTTPLVAEGEVFYIEPIFIRSKQNPLPRLERVIVVFRGRAVMQESLEEAVKAALKPGARFPIRPGPELGGEPAFDASGRLIAPNSPQGGVAPESPDAP